MALPATQKAAPAEATQKLQTVDYLTLISSVFSEDGSVVPPELEVHWDSTQLFFSKGQKHVTDQLVIKILRHERSKELVSVDLGLCFRITDAALAVISDMPHLRQLSLAGCFNISDKGIMSLSKNSTLTNLVLYRCQKLTDLAIKAICSSKYRLFVLSVAHCYELTNDAFEFISEQSNLIELDLTYTKLTDHGLRYFGGLQNLCRVNLYYCQAVTKSGLNLLCQLPQLAEVNCRYTKVTKGNGVVFQMNEGRTKVIAGDK